jgi:DnaJ-domain-containing protein 1
MTDYFKLLNEPRRPWLEAEALKGRFLQISSTAHPDRFHNSPAEEKARAGQQYAELNAAWQCLSEPKERLLHLLELEGGARPKDVQRIPPGTMDLFMEVGQLCREVDVFLGERGKVTSPLLRVQMFERGLEWTDKLNALQAKVNALQDGLTAELQSMNRAWETAPAVGTPEREAALPLEQLEQVYRRWSYVGRWTEQLQERLVQLAMQT